MLDSYSILLVYLDMNKTLNIKQLNKKLALPVKRNANGQVIPTKFTNAQLNHIIFVKLAKVRKANGNSFGKNLTANQVHKQRLVKGIGTTGSRPMNI